MSQAFLRSLELPAECESASGETGLGRYSTRLANLPGKGQEVDRKHCIASLNLDSLRRNHSPFHFPRINSFLGPRKHRELGPIGHHVFTPISRERFRNGPLEAIDAEHLSCSSSWRPAKRRGGNPKRSSSLRKHSILRRMCPRAATLRVVSSMERMQQLFRRHDMLFSQVHFPWAGTILNAIYPEQTKHDLQALNPES